jgi:hypothetical protein
MQYLENSQGVFKKQKQDQNSKGFERRQSNGREQGGGRHYREAPPEISHVRYGYRQGNPGTPHRQNTSVRRRNYQTDRRNMQQAHELNPQTPEFQPRSDKMSSNDIIFIPGFVKIDQVIQTLKQRHNNTQYTQTAW